MLYNYANVAFTTDIIIAAPSLKSIYTALLLLDNAHLHQLMQSFIANVKNHASGTNLGEGGCWVQRNPPYPNSFDLLVRILLPAAFDSHSYSTNFLCPIQYTVHLTVHAGGNNFCKGGATCG